MHKVIGLVPKQLYVGLLAAFIIAAYGWVGESDLKNEVSNAEFYCKMALDGYWPVKPDMTCPVPEITPGDHLVAR